VLDDVLGEVDVLVVEERLLDGVQQRLVLAADLDLELVVGLRETVSCIGSRDLQGIFNRNPALGPARRGP